MISRLHHSVLAFCFFVAPSVTAAQSGSVEPGARIRFAIGGTDFLHEATLARIGADSLFLQKCTTCERLTYSRSEVNRLAVFRKSGAGSRAVTGFGIGGLVGLALGGIAMATCHGVGDACDGALVALPFEGLAGGLIGSLAGYLTGYKWLPITGLP